MFDNDSCLVASKFDPDWSVMSKVIEKPVSAVFSEGYVFFDDLASHFVTFFSEDKDHNSINLDNINLDDDHFEYCVPETVNHDLRVGIRNVSNAKYLKKIDKELLLVILHPIRVWDWCMSGDEKKEDSIIFLQF